MNKKIPMRSCVVTNEKLPKYELIRIVMNKDKEIFVDETSKANGRGVYIKKDIEVLEKAIKSKILEKKLESKISENIYETIRNIINN